MGSALSDLVSFQILGNPPASEASREVANLTERKNPHAPIYGVKEFVCLLSSRGGLVR